MSTKIKGSVIMSKLTRREFIKTMSLATLAISMPINVFAADNCTVKTRYGTFNGFVDEKGVKTWLGIPYAQPPVGKLRWQAPQPLKPTNKTFDAKKFGFTACQDIDKNEGDYSALLDIKHVGFVEDGLAVSTGALPFDQVAQNTHILIIPYEKVNHLLVERFRR